MNAELYIHDIHPDSLRYMRNFVPPSLDSSASQHHWYHQQLLDEVVTQVRKDELNCAVQSPESLD
jgi:hypothetical protein